MATDDDSVALGAKPADAPRSSRLFGPFVVVPRSSICPARRMPPIVVATEPNRPQPRLDVDRGDGMAITVGRIRPCQVTHAKFVALGHNTVRGAAGAAILNAELMAADGIFD